QFVSWLGWLAPDDRPLVFVLNREQDTDELVRQARTIGYDQLAGVMSGGIAAWRRAGLPVTSTELVAAARLDRTVVDVRQAAEHAVGHIPGAVHVELGVVDRAVTELPAGPIAVMCAHGERAATAASLL